MTSPTIILINGPKTSGKDYTAELIHDHHHDEVKKLKFATPLYEAVRSMFQIEPLHWEWMYNNQKETPFAELFGMTPRQALIWISEDIMKPKFGTNVMGIIAATAVENAISEGLDVITFSDSGFDSEAKVIVDKFGAENVQLIRIYAQGCDFTGDSRGYVEPRLIGISDKNFTEVYNDKTFNYDAVIYDLMNKIL